MSSPGSHLLRGLEPRFLQCDTCAHVVTALYFRECGEGVVDGGMVDGVPSPPDIVNSPPVAAWRKDGAGRCPGWAARELPDDTPLPTAGPLLSRVREAYADPTITTQYHPNEGGPDRKRWRVWRQGQPIAYGVTEAEALVVALERSAAPPAAPLKA